ncbi:MAG: hypothetical protein AAGJ35_01325, partial [Myxococcota bacterium]
LRCTYKMSRAFEQIFLALKKGKPNKNESPWIQDVLQALKNNDLAQKTRLFQPHQETLTELQKDFEKSIQRVREAEQKRKEQRLAKIQEGKRKAQEARKILEHRASLDNLPSPQISVEQMPSAATPSHASAAHIPSTTPSNYIPPADKVPISVQIPSAMTSSTSSKNMHESTPSGAGVPRSDSTPSFPQSVPTPNTLDFLDAVVSFAPQEELNTSLSFLDATLIAPEEDLSQPSNSGIKLPMVEETPSTEHLLASMAPLEKELFPNLTEKDLFPDLPKEQAFLPSQNQLEKPSKSTDDSPSHIEDALFDLNQWAFVCQDQKQTPPPLPATSDEVRVILPMLEEHSPRMREVAKDSVRMLDHQQAVPSLVYELMKHMPPGALKEDGSLHNASPALETLWELFQERKQYAFTALCIQLYHNIPEQNRPLLDMLYHLEPSLTGLAHLLHFQCLKSPNAEQKALPLLRHHKSSQAFQTLLHNIHEQFHTLPTDYALAMLDTFTLLHAHPVGSIAKKLLGKAKEEQLQKLLSIILLSARGDILHHTKQHPYIPPHNLLYYDAVSGQRPRVAQLPSVSPSLHVVAAAPFVYPPNQIQLTAQLEALPDHERTIALLTILPDHLSTHQIDLLGNFPPQTQHSFANWLWDRLTQTKTSEVLCFVNFLYHATPNEQKLTLQALLHLHVHTILNYLIERIQVCTEEVLPYYQAVFLHPKQQTLHENLSVSLYTEWRSANKSSTQFHYIRLFERLFATSAIPQLLNQLEEQDYEVQQATIRALQELTKQDFGEQPKKWKKWWDKQGSRTTPVDWLIGALSHKDPEQAQRAHHQLVAMTQQNFPFQADDDKKAKQQAIQQWKSWRKQQVF